MPMANRLNDNPFLWYDDINLFSSGTYFSSARNGFIQLSMIKFKPQENVFTTKFFFVLFCLQ